MTVSTTSSKQAAQTGDGSNKTFQYGFRILSASDLEVRIRTTSTGAETDPLTLTTDYTVTNVGQAGGGNVVLTASYTAPTSDQQVFIKRVMDLTQTTDYVPNDPFPAASHEDALDKLTFIAQQQSEELDRAIVFPETDTASTTIPDSVTRAGKFLGFGASGEVVTLDSTGAAPSSVDTGTIVDSAVTAAKIADSAVTTAKIADGTIATADIADDAVTVAKININGEELVLDADGDTSITADTDDQIDFKTGGSDRVTIDSSGNVGINETSPDALLHVTTSDFQAVQLEGPRPTVFFKETDGSANENYQIRIEGGDLRFQQQNDAQNNAVDTMLLDPDRGVRIGTESNIFESASNEKLSVKNTAQGHAATFQVTNVTGGFPILYLDSQDTANTSQNTVLFRRDGSDVGTITTTASTTAYNTTSDHRLKENVADMTGAIDRVKALAPKRFNFTVAPNKTVDGFIAHEAQTVVPEAVTGTHNEVDADGNAVMQGIDQSKLVPLLTGALKEAITKIEALEARVTTLENA